LQAGDAAGAKKMNDEVIDLVNKMNSLEDASDDSGVDESEISMSNFDDTESI